MSLSEDLTNFKISITDAVKECRQLVIDESKLLNHEITKVKYLLESICLAITRGNEVWVFDLNTAADFKRNGVNHFSPSKGSGAVNYIILEFGQEKSVERRLWGVSCPKQQQGDGSRWADYLTRQWYQKYRKLCWKIRSMQHPEFDHWEPCSVCF